MLSKDGGLEKYWLSNIQSRRLSCSPAFQALTNSRRKWLYLRIKSPLCMKLPSNYFSCNQALLRTTQEISTIRTEILRNGPWNVWLLAWSRHRQSQQNINSTPRTQKSCSDLSSTASTGTKTKPCLFFHAYGWPKYPKGGLQCWIPALVQSHALQLSIKHRKI